MYDEIQLKAEEAHTRKITELQVVMLTSIGDLARQITNSLKANPKLITVHKTTNPSSTIPPIPALEHMGDYFAPGLEPDEKNKPSNQTEHLMSSFKIAREILGLSEDSSIPDMLYWAETSPDWFRIRHLNNAPFNLEVAVNAVLENMSLRVMAQLIYNLCDAMNELCDAEGCDLHLDGANDGIMNIMPTQRYLTEARAIARDKVAKHGRVFIENMLDKTLNSPGAEFLKDIIGQKFNPNMWQQEVADSSYHSLQELKKTNPGLVGTWVYGLRQNPYSRRGEPSFETADHPSAIVRWVARESGLKPGTMAWKYLASMSVKNAYEFMTRGTEIQYTSRSWNFTQVRIILEQHAIAINSPKLNKPAIMRLKSATSSILDRPMYVFKPIISAYLKEIAKPVAKRGRTIAQLNVELTDILDWGDALYRAFNNRHRGTESVDIAASEVIPPQSWRAMIRLSNSWHEQVIIKAQAVNKKEVTQRWESLVDKYEDDNYIITPLVTDVDLKIEGSIANNCVGSYNYLCVNNISRIFSLASKKRRGRAKNPTSHVATIEILSSRNEQEDHRVWRAGQVQGHRSRFPSKIIREIAANIAERYTVAEKERAGYQRQLVVSTSTSHALTA